MERPAPEHLAVARSIGTPQPGSIDERAALDAIDQARHEELYPQSRTQARRRMRRYWSDRGHALGD